MGYLLRIVNNFAFSGSTGSNENARIVFDNSSLRNAAYSKAIYAHDYASNCGTSSSATAQKLGVPQTHDSAPVMVHAPISSPAGGEALSEEGEILHSSSLPPNCTDAVQKRDLLTFISACGLSTKDVNDFVSLGSIPTSSTAHKVFALSSKSGKAGAPSPDNDSVKVTVDSVNTAALVSAKDSVLGPYIQNGSLVQKAGNTSPSTGPTPPPKEKSWSSVVSQGSGKTNLALSFFPPSVVNGKVLINPPIDFLQKGNSLWASSLVGYFLHSKLPYKVVEPIAMRIWGSLGLTKVYLHAKGYYIFKFNSFKERDNVLARGPWHFASRPIVLQPWKEGGDFFKADCTKMPLWVKLSNIPFSYLSAEGISLIASGIGKPLFADEMTSSLEPLNFARICIEMSADSTFPDSINANIFDEEYKVLKCIAVDVEYQNRPPCMPYLHLFWSPSS